MMMKPGFSFVLLVTTGSFLFFACNKPKDDPGIFSLSYGDSILYLKPGSSQVVYPRTSRPGSYTSFPDGLDLDQNTGAINVQGSETGLRYEVTHTDPEGKKTSAMIVVSGINYPDFYFNISTGDTIAYPVYNASEIRPLPAGSQFDVYGEAAGDNCVVDPVTGGINLSKSIREGLFGSNPENDDRRDIDIVYRLNDNSQQADNELRVRLYYYTSMATVAPDILQIVEDRQASGVFLRDHSSGRFSRVAGRLALTSAPRPPCVIIIAN
jgi:hypothetical protein